MGDVLSLIEEAEKKGDKKQAEKLAKKIKKGKGFDLEDFKEQLKQMQNMGGVANIMDKLPGMGALPPGAAGMVDDSQFRRMEAIINSMTMRERVNPDVLNGSRKRRITQGSGTQIQDLNRLLKQHTDAESDEEDERWQYGQHDAWSGGHAGWSRFRRYAGNASRR